jgi:hypothetical protein
MAGRGAAAEDVLNTTAEQSRRIDKLTLAAGRDPVSVRRSYHPRAVGTARKNVHLRGGLRRAQLPGKLTGGLMGPFSHLKPIR